jgi:hypothetical protein
MVSRVVGIRLAVCGNHADVPRVADHQAAAVPAHREPVDLVGQLGAALLQDAEALKCRSRVGVTRARAAFAQVSGDRLPEPGEAALDRAQRPVARLGYRQLHDPARELTGIDLDRRHLAVVRVAARYPG